MEKTYVNVLVSRELGHSVHVQSPLLVKLQKPKKIKRCAQDINHFCSFNMAQSAVIDVNQAENLQ